MILISFLIFLNRCLKQNFDNQTPMEFWCFPEKQYYNNPRPMALSLDSNLNVERTNLINYLREIAPLAIGFSS